MDHHCRRERRNIWRWIGNGPEPVATSADVVVTYEAGPVELDLAGTTVSTLGYSRSIPGPLLRARAVDVVTTAAESSYRSHRHVRNAGRCTSIKARTVGSAASAQRTGASFIPTDINTLAEPRDTG